jgi:hypothetical protein
MTRLSLHPSGAWTSDRRPIFPDHLRDLPAAIALGASFSIAIGFEEDRRAAHEKSVASCEGSSCVISSRKGDTNG